MMLKKLISLLVVVFMSPLGMFSQDKMILRESEGIDFVQLMGKNEIYMKFFTGADIDENNHLYLLDNQLGNVIRMDLKTGALVKKISSSGQGPAELMAPTVLRVLHGKVFVLSANVAVKVFSINGEFLSGFKTEQIARWMDVDEKENIYIAETDSKSNPVISVYDSQGKRTRSAVTFPLTKDQVEDKAQSFVIKKFLFKLDSEGNFIVLHPILRELKKFSTAGNLLWKRKIENSILKPYMKKENIKSDSSGITITLIVNCFDIDRQGNIVVGHIGGGCVYNPKGDLIKLLEIYPKEQKKIPPPLYRVKIIGNSLLGEYNDGSAFLFDYRLDGNQ